MKADFNLSHNEKKHYQHYFLLLLICLITYWPLTFGFFSVKNDAIHYFLPYRFHISEALRNGEWPFWSPYIYLGYPVYGDMQSGAWNPIVWVFSAISRYDLTLFHFENLLYIFLSGIGMYKLTNRFVSHSRTSLLVATSYMLSGFMLSGQLINWLASAAFIPFVLLYFLRTIEKNSFQDAAKTALSLFLLLTAGYPSFFIIICYLLLILFSLKCLNKFRKKETTKQWRYFFFSQGAILILFTGLSLPAIVSYIDLLPYYHRGSGATYDEIIRNSFEWKHLLSFLFPSSIKAADISSSTDVTCRNLYIGLYILPIFIIFPPKLSRRNICLILLALFSLLFSAGDSTPVRNLCYEFVPLMDTFRHPSQMRLFIILSVLLLSAPSIKLALNSKTLSLEESKKAIIVLWLTITALFIITAAAIFQSTIISQPNILGSGTDPKEIIETLTLNDTISVNGIIQLFFALLALWLFRKKNKFSFFPALWISNLFIMAQFILPITFVSQTNPKEINAIIHQSPKGFPLIRPDRTLSENSKDAYDNFEKISLSYFYNKKIGISKITNSPSFLTQHEEFINYEQLFKYISSRPVIYIADSILAQKPGVQEYDSLGCNYAIIDNNNINLPANCQNAGTAILKKLSANKLLIEATVTSKALLIITQNYHHCWLAKEGKTRKDIYKVNESFMGISLSPGKHEIELSFLPGITFKALWVQGITILILVLFTILTLFRKYR